MNREDEFDERWYEEREERLMAGLDLRDRMADYESVIPESIRWDAVDEEERGG